MHQTVVTYDSSGKACLSLRVYPATYCDLGKRVAPWLARMQSVVTPPLLSALLILLLALPFLVTIERLPMGTVSRMGPGFVPASTLVGMIGIAVLIFLWGLCNRGPDPDAQLPMDGDAIRGLLAIAAGVLAFLLLLPAAGLLPAVAAASLLCALGRRTVRLSLALGLSLFNAVVTWVVFILFLGLPFQAIQGF
jgi:hypothetical protein